MSENQPDCFFSMLEHATVPVRATKFTEVETGLNRAMICINVSNFFYVFSKNWPFNINATFEVWPVNSSFWTDFDGSGWPLF